MAIEMRPVGASAGCGCVAVAVYGYTVIPVLTNQSPISEAMPRYRGKQGQENAFKGPLIDLDLHHPPCSIIAENQAYTCIALLLHVLRVVQYLFAVRLMSAHFENYHRTLGGTPGNAHLYFSSVLTVFLQESAKQVFEIAYGGHDQYLWIEKVSS